MFLNDTHQILYKLDVAAMKQMMEKLSSCLSLFLYKNLLFSLPRPFQLFLLDHLALLLGVSWFDDQQAAP
jgi:hypothetical protein